MVVGEGSFILRYMSVFKVKSVCVCGGADGMILKSFKETKKVLYFSLLPTLFLGCFGEVANSEELC